MANKTSVEHPVASSRIAGIKQKAEHLIGKVQESDEELEVAEQEELPSKRELKMGSLRDLVFLGRLQKEIEFGDYRFKVTTLTSEQSQRVLEIIVKHQSDVLTFSIVATMTEALVSINDIPFDRFAAEATLPEGVTDDLQERKIHIISSWQTALINALFKGYTILTKEAGEFFSLSEKEKTEEIKK